MARKSLKNNTVFLMELEWEMKPFCFPACVSHSEIKKQLNLIEVGRGVKNLPGFSWKRMLEVGLKAGVH